MGIQTDLSIVIPAKNEARNLERFLPTLKELYPDAEIIVVNDGSTDDTAAVCERLGVRTLSHGQSKGNGASIKNGARHARGRTLVFMDGDGQHDPHDISRLMARYEQGADMVVGARSATSQASRGRLAANTLYNKLASWITNSRVEDLTSGFRVVDRAKFVRYLYLLPNGFSYPTTITMAFFRAGLQVEYEPIMAGKREGKSHINLLRDGIRFLLIIFKVGTLYSPLKIFFPLSCLFFITGLTYYLYTYINAHSFTNMGVLMFMTSIIVFLIGLVSEQVTMLIYKESED